MHICFLGLVNNYAFLFPRADITNYRKLGGLKKQKLIFSLFWRMGVQNQGAGRTTISLKALEENPFRPLPASAGSRCPVACWQHYVTLGLCRHMVSVSIPLLFS